MSTGDLEVEDTLLEETRDKHLALLARVEEDALRVGRLEGDLQLDARLDAPIVRVEDVNQVGVAEET